MKRILTFILISLLGAFTAHAQGTVETIKPETTENDIVREIDSMDIEGEFYCNVTVHIKSTPQSQYVTPSVKVKIVETATGKTVFSKTLKGSYLFLFSDGQIQIGKRSLRQIAISKPGKGSAGIIRIKEGIWL